MTKTNKLSWIREALNTLKDNGLLSNIRTLNSAQGAWLTVDGRKVLNFCSNNYLGQANHPSLIQAAHDALG